MVLLIWQLSDPPGFVPALPPLKSCPRRVPRTVHGGTSVSAAHQVTSECRDGRMRSARAREHPEPWCGVVAPCPIERYQVVAESQVRHTSVRRGWGSSPSHRWSPSAGCSGQHCSTAPASEAAHRARRSAERRGQQRGAGAGALAGRSACLAALEGVSVDVTVRVCRRVTAPPTIDRFISVPIGLPAVP